MVNKLDETKKFVLNWRKEHGIPADSKALPPKDSVPQWMRLYLDRVKKDSGLKISDMPRYIKGGTPDNVIWKAPGLDSPVIDNWKKRGYTPGMEIPKPGGPQLPDFVQLKDKGLTIANNKLTRDEFAIIMDKLNTIQKYYPEKYPRELKRLREMYPNYFPLDMAQGPDYSDIPNARDLKIKDAIKEFGKDPKTGKYKNPALLIKNLPRA
tara:strand:- start:117 stop:743 length:627 start_codon:yes stop_codon:yes gene_type:complete